MAVTSTINIHIQALKAPTVSFPQALWWGYDWNVTGDVSGGQITSNIQHTNKTDQIFSFEELFVGVDSAADVIVLVDFNTAMTIPGYTDRIVPSVSETITRASIGSGGKKIACPAYLFYGTEAWYIATRVANLATTTLKQFAWGYMWDSRAFVLGQPIRPGLIQVV